MSRPPKTLKERFEKNILVQVSGKGCWIWTGYTNNSGYGKIWLLEYKRQLFVHRVSMHLFKGFNLFSEDYICHTCDVSVCVNPDHLYVGNASTNNRDTIARNRHGNKNKTHCPKGHEYNEENTYLYKKGYRSCKQCKRDFAKKKYYEDIEKSRNRNRENYKRRKDGDTSYIHNTKRYNR